MKITRCTALALVVLLGLALRGHAEAPSQPQLREQPAIAPAPEQAQSTSPTSPMSTPSHFLGLSMTQVWVLAGVSMVFVLTAILMRWWLSEPAAEEAETPPAPGPQDVSQ
jgi:hypothetical protein